ncbi:MAG: biotin--[acetyl-CoA-carboxylase] ligase [Sphaerobacteraceae bacterium]|nr:MAG: biotin--[acetyl-CoA-carboxylase] ligase [Sphaerobacteraceae bacterium]
MHWIIERHEVVGSTMDDASQHARRGAPTGVVIVAGEQTAGRGQYGRQWLAPAGSSLLMTAIARPDCSPDRLEHIPELVGHAVSRAIERWVGVQCDIKLPNDLMVEGRKIAGILCQSSIEGQKVHYILVGIGINVNLDRDDLPLPTATSIQIETGKPGDVNELLDRVLDELEECWCFGGARTADVPRSSDE